MSEPKTPITCDHHGKSFATFVCRHIGEGGDALGFYHGSPPNDPRPDAWCATCEERLKANNYEWDDEITALSNIMLICAGCYDTARQRNEVLHRRVKPETRPTLEEDGWELESARHQNHLYPQTFSIPLPKELQRLRAGDTVKLLFLFATSDKPGAKILCERMWVNITKVTPTSYTGTLANDPTLSKVLKLNDMITFQRQHIASIYREDVARHVLKQNQNSGIRQSQTSVNNRYC